MLSPWRRQTVHHWTVCLPVSGASHSSFQALVLHDPLALDLLALPEAATDGAKAAGSAAEIQHFSLPCAECAPSRWHFPIECSGLYAVCRMAPSPQPAQDHLRHAVNACTRRALIRPVAA